MQIVDSQIHLWENARMSPQHRQIPLLDGRRLAGDGGGRGRRGGDPSAQHAG